jgi:hypothetical protein
MVVTKRMADAEMHCILGNLRGCVGEVFVGNDGLAFDHLSRFIRVKQ